MRLTSVLWEIGYAEAAAMNVIPLASGGAPYREWTTKIIRFVRHGCANRPFFHIAVQEGPEEQYGKVIEQVGVYDPLPNEHNEKLVGLNLNRIQHWVNNGAVLSIPVKKLLGLAGYYPVHPQTFRAAWVRRKLLMETLAELEAAAASESEKATSDNESAGSTSAA